MKRSGMGRYKKKEETGRKMAGEKRGEKREGKEG